MILLGIVLILLGALAIVAALFTAEITTTGDLELLGTGVSPAALFLVGAGAGLAILWGFSLFKYGSRRSWAARKEKKRLTELSAKLDRVEAERRKDVDHQEEQDRPTL